MALVPYVTSDERCEGFERLESFEQTHGKRSLLLEALANHPPLLEAHSQYFEKTVLQGNLDRKLKELVGVYVSVRNECEYCASSHSDNLVELYDIAETTIQRLGEHEFDAFSPIESTVLTFTRRVVEDPKRITEDDLDTLREIGFDDAAIVELLGAIGQFSLANMYVDVLSISPAER